MKVFGCLHIQSSVQRAHIYTHTITTMTMTMIDTSDKTNKCFKYLDGAARLTIKNMRTSEMKELAKILLEEIKFREDIGKEINAN